MQAGYYLARPSLPVPSELDEGAQSDVWDLLRATAAGRRGVLVSGVELLDEEAVYGVSAWKRGGGD